MKSKLKKLLNKVLFFFPSALPVGMQSLDTWISSIISTYDFPDNDSTRFALSTMILHLESSSKFEINLLLFKVLIPTSAYKSKRYFAQTALKSMSNQVAAGLMHELKEKQKKAEEAAVKEAQEQQNVQA